MKMVLALLFSLCRKLVTKSEAILCAGVLTVLSDQTGSCFSCVVSFDW